MGRDVVNKDVACIDLPEFEITLVALQGVGAEAFGGFVLQEAYRGLGYR
jgi:hypothetical protein